MMKTFWLFRSNLRIIEYYHQYRDIETFKKQCHDFYLLQGIWFLENTDIEEFVVWRLKPKKPIKNIVMKVNGKLFKQIFVDNFDEVVKYEPPLIAFFRGGFEEYDNLIKKYSKFFKNSRTLYLGASKRITPQYGGKYDLILVEDELELKKIKNSIPFYKTANENIFNVIKGREKIIDIIWICNNTQFKIKGQEYFINKLRKSDYLRSLSILHVGNEPDKLSKLLNKYNIKNIHLAGYLNRHQINVLLNSSKLALITSDKTDGCPRLITEILCTDAVLICRSKTRMLDYYRKAAVIFDDGEIENKVKFALKNLKKYKNKKNNYDIDNICKLNLLGWSVPVQLL